MKEHIFPAIKLTLICLVFFSGVYTTAILAIAQLAPNRGRAEVIVNANKKYYSNVGQKFTDDKYFNSRPSAVEYNAAGAGGSNKGPSNPGYLKIVQDRIDTFLVHNPGIKKKDIPSDIVTASGGGLDPHISVPAALVQSARIARVRNMAEGNIQQLILSHTKKPLLGLMGTERINTLELNIALDNLK